jgi:hypothetical protein
LSLSVKNNKPKYCYKQLARDKYESAPTEPLPSGKVRLMSDFDYNDGVTKGGNRINSRQQQEGSRLILGGPLIQILTSEGLFEGGSCSERG